MAKRASRVRRQPPLKNIRLTERDVQILKYLHRFTVLAQRDIHALVGGDYKSLVIRLRLLFDHGYTTRPQIQEDMYRYEEQRPTVEALGQVGATYLREVEGYSLPPTVNWDRKAQSRG